MWTGQGGANGHYNVSIRCILEESMGGMIIWETGNDLSFGKICNFVNSLISFGAGISRIAHNKTKTGHKFSSREESVTFSVSSGIVLSMTSIIRPTTLVSDPGGKRSVFDCERGRLRRQWTTFVTGDSNLLKQVEVSNSMSGAVNLVCQRRLLGMGVQ